jgi:O-antigen ligase
MPAVRWFFKNIAFIGALLMVSGTVIAEATPAFLSVGCVFILLHPFINDGFKSTYQAIRANRFVWPLLIYYLLILATFFYTHDTFEYGLYIQRQLPLIFLGIGLAIPGIFSRKQVNIIFSTLVGAVLVAGIASFVNYMLHFDEINESITHSKPIPIVTRVNHIHYSILLAFSVLILLYQLLITGIADRVYRNIAIAVAVVLFLLLHTIAARTGLAAFYISVFVGIIWYMARRKKLGLAIMLIAGVCISGILAVSFIPSLKTRFENTRYDLQRYSNGEDPNNYSISERFESTKNAYRLWQRHPLVGVAPADLRDEVYKQYEMDNTQLQGDNRTLPHNQFLLTATCMGIIGFLVLLWMFLLPLFNRNARHCILFMLFMVLCFVSFQVESVLERQVGISFFCLFYMILSTQLSNQRLDEQVIPKTDISLL